MRAIDLAVELEVELSVRETPREHKGRTLWLREFQPDPHRYRIELVNEEAIRVKYMSAPEHFTKTAVLQTVSRSENARHPGDWPCRQIGCAQLSLEESR